MSERILTRHPDRGKQATNIEVRDLIQRVARSCPLRIHLGGKAQDAHS